MQSSKLGMLIKGIRSFNRRYTKGVSFLPKMVYKRVRGWTSGQSLPRKAGSHLSKYTWSIARELTWPFRRGSRASLTPLMSKRRMCRLSWGSAIILFTGETESLWTQKHSFYYGKNLWQSYCKFFFLVSVAKNTLFSALEHLYSHLISRCKKWKVTKSLSPVYK